MTPENPNREYYPALDVLRGIAILLVIAYHNFDFLPFFKFGYLGVDLFFVLSGFLITDILLKTRNEKNWLQNFYARRIFRIFPLYYLSLFIVLYIIPHITHVNIGYYQQHQVWLWLYLQNWLYITNVSNHTHLLHHFWSLAIEEQFYLFWPLIFLFVKNRKIILMIALLLLAAVVLSRLFIYLHDKHNFLFTITYTFTRIDGILIGSSIALIHSVNANWIKNHVKMILFLLIAMNVVYLSMRWILPAFHDFPYIPFLGIPSFAALFGLVIYYSARVFH